MGPAADKPLVLLLAGLPGVGKTALAAELAPLLSGVILNRDAIRDSIFPTNYLDYSSAQNEVATVTLLSVLSYLLEHRPPPITLIDGKPFSRRAEIETVQRRADQHGATLIVLHCVAPASVIDDRLQRGLADPVNVRAQRDPDKASRIRQQFEPIVHRHITIDMAGSIDAAARRCVDLLNRRSETLGTS